MGREARFLRTGVSFLRPAVRFLRVEASFLVAGALILGREASFLRPGARILRADAPILRGPLISSVPFSDLSQLRSHLCQYTLHRSCLRRLEFY